MTEAGLWDEETQPVMGTFSPMLPWDNSSLIFSQLECCSPATVHSPTPGWSQQTEKTKTEQNTLHDSILYLHDGDPSVSTFAMASLYVSSLRRSLVLFLLLLLLQLCLFDFLTASQIQEYHFCFFPFLTITEFLFLSNLSRRLEDLNLDLLWVCLSTLSARPIFLHHFSIFPPAIFVLHYQKSCQASPE